MLSLKSGIMDSGEMENDSYLGPCTAVVDMPREATVSGAFSTKTDKSTTYESTKEPNSTIFVTDGSTTDNSTQFLSTETQSHKTAKKTYPVLPRRFNIKPPWVLHTDPIPSQYSSPSSPRRTVWEAHYRFFLVVIILIAVCIVVLCTFCVYMRWRDREKRREKKLMQMEDGNSGNALTIGVSRPIPDQDIIQDENAPMQERENPEASLNISIKEDNGCVVPIDEFTKAEKEKPEVENTQL